MPSQFDKIHYKTMMLITSVEENSASYRLLFWEMMMFFWNKMMFLISVKDYWRRKYGALRSVNIWYIYFFIIDNMMLLQSIILSLLWHFKNVINFLFFLLVNLIIIIVFHFISYILDLKMNNIKYKYQRLSHMDDKK